MIELLICTVLVFSDGDSGRCQTPEGERHRIRLSGIDAPETGQRTRCRQQPGIWACTTPPAWGDRATARARQLASNGARCEVSDRDRYGRIVAACRVNGVDIGSVLVREGLAISDPHYGTEAYRRDEAQARRERRGVWE